MPHAAASWHFQESLCGARSSKGEYRSEERPEHRCAESGVARHGDVGDRRLFFNGLNRSTPSRSGSALRTSKWYTAPALSRVTACYLPLLPTCWHAFCTACSTRRLSAVGERRSKGETREHRATGIPQLTPGGSFVAAQRRARGEEHVVAPPKSAQSTHVVERSRRPRPCRWTRRMG